MTRRLVREEGIFCGGSSGSAVAGLLKSQVVCALRPGQIAVVILPDSGDRYLSKVFDDNWMREHSYFSTPLVEDTVGGVLKKKDGLPLITTSPHDLLTEVVGLMKSYDISQLPVTDESGSLVGIVTETDLLDHLLHADHVHDPEETIAAIVNPNVTIVFLEESIETVMAAFEGDKFVVVAEQDKAVGILTKIDIVDYLAGWICP
jgi:cystathionine beta-synthase